jgi:hypothetical protein
MMSSLTLIGSIIHQSITYFNMPRPEHVFLKKVVPSKPHSQIDTFVKNETEINDKLPQLKKFQLKERDFADVPILYVSTRFSILSNDKYKAFPGTLGSLVKAFRGFRISSLLAMLITTNNLTTYIKIPRIRTLNIMLRV